MTTIKNERRDDISDIGVEKFDEFETEEDNTRATDPEICIPGVYHQGILENLLTEESFREIERQRSIRFKEV